MPEGELRDGVSLRKAGDAAPAPAVQLRKRDGADPCPPTGHRRTVFDPPLAVRAPRRARLRVALPLLGLLLAALVGLARFAHVAEDVAAAGGRSVDPARGARRCRQEVRH